ncbi:MAG: hypothetical protein EOP54_03530 [Sphingobacteriales bacterium]|nr:MAG: hypothetical protein EOP54_03530 [Sphingobacteriales bacterium]
MCTGFFSLVACKESSITKAGLVPEVDNINTFAKSTSDFGITFSHGTADAIITSNFAYDHNGSASPFSAIAIGAYTDPFFGKTVASAHFQLTPYSSSFKFPDGAVIDSAVLVLPYIVANIAGSYYGDTESVNTWNIYKNDAVLEKSKVYYSSDNVNTGTLIGSGTVRYHQFKGGVKNILAATNDTTTAQLRMKLNQSFATEMFAADSNVYKSTTAFFDYFKGITISPDMTQPQQLLAYFLLPSSTTWEQKMLSDARIEFHYHTPTDTTFSSIVVRPSVAAYYSTIKQENSSFPVANLLNRNSDSILIQSQPGLRTDITLTGLNDIPLAVVNKAELVFTVQNPDPAYLLPFSPIVPVIVNDNGTEMPLYERIDNNGSANDAGIAMVNPYAARVDINGVTYTRFKINIPRTIQQYILERKDKIIIRLKGTNYNPGMYRILANGLNASDDMKFKFNLIYTKKNN